jgi:hypothetical protein
MFSTWSTRENTSIPHGFPPREQTNHSTEANRKKNSKVAVMRNFSSGGLGSCLVGNWYKNSWLIIKLRFKLFILRTMKQNTNLPHKVCFAKCCWLELSFIFRKLEGVVSNVTTGSSSVGTCLMSDQNCLSSEPSNFCIVYLLFCGASVKILEEGIRRKESYI